MTPSDVRRWALAQGAAPEVADEVADAWGAHGVRPVDRYLEVLGGLVAEAVRPGQRAEVARWSELAATAMLAAWRVRPPEPRRAERWPMLEGGPDDVAWAQQAVDLGHGQRLPRSQVEAAVRLLGVQQAAAREAYGAEPCEHCGHARREHRTDSGAGLACSCGCTRAYEVAWARGGAS